MSLPVPCRSLSLRRLSGIVYTPSPCRRCAVANSLFRSESANVVEYPFVGRSCAGPSCVPRMGTIVIPDEDNSCRHEALVIATRFVSAFCSSSDDVPNAHTSPTFRISRLTLKIAPCRRKDLQRRMETRSYISCMSMAARQLLSARASLTAVSALSGILSFSGSGYVFQISV